MRIQKLPRGVWVLAGALAALAAFWLGRRSPAAMAWWVDCVSMPVKRAVSFLVDPLPFSACEAGIVLLVILELALLVRAVRQKRFWHWLAQFAAVGAWIYWLVCALWGTQYYAPTFSRRAGMADAPVSQEDLMAVDLYFAAQVNRTAPATPRDDEGALGLTQMQLMADTKGVYDGLTEEYPFLAGPERHAKPAVFSKLMSASGYTGYICPLFGESTLNVDSPPAFLPAIIAHEFAHQRGVAAEQEANFVGVRAAVTCGKPVYEYSGWLLGWQYLNNALYETAPEASTACYQTLCDEAKADIRINNAYWARWEGPVHKAVDTVYEGFLQSYGQEQGLRSYGACVDLLVEYYREAAWQAIVEE